MDDLDGSHMPIITLEVMTEALEDENDQIVQTEEDYQSSINENNIANGISQTEDIESVQEYEEEIKTSNEIKEERELKEYVPRYELLEYQMRTNGTVICKLCGEILRSRTHWYRHKYKQHSGKRHPILPPLNPSPLFQCEQCLCFFKSRKGYIGHLASRHSDVLSDSNPTLPTEPTPEVVSEIPEETPTIKEEPDTDIEMSISDTNVAYTQTIPADPVMPVVKMETKNTNKVSRSKSGTFFRSVTDTDCKDWAARRSREEKLVADIIARVRRECEAQGSGGAARKGYTRRTTVMDKC